jgi:hypothetical protein
VSEVTVLDPIASPASARSEITPSLLSLSEKAGVLSDISKRHGLPRTRGCRQPQQLEYRTDPAALNDSIMAEPITLLVKTGCTYRAAERGEFQQKSVKFTEIIVTDRFEVIPELLRLTRGERLVPIAVQGQSVRVASEGGCGF